MGSHLECVGIAAAAVFTCAAHGEQVKFFGGDPAADGGGSMRSSTTTYRTDSYFDDFQWDGSTVTSVFGNFTLTGFWVDSIHVSGAEVEIRSGISHGDGGTLVYSAYSNLFTQSDSGFDQSFGSDPIDVFTFDIDLDDFSLDAGQYWIAIRLVIEGDGMNDRTGAIVARTEGTNGIGSPLANGNTFFSGPGSDFEPVDGFVDASYGIRGEGATLIPLPSACALAGLGLAAVGARRRRAI